MVVRDKLIPFVSFLHRKGVKKVSLPLLEKWLAIYFGVKENTAQAYLKDLVKFGLMETEGNIFKLKKKC